jgi:succinate dehydrogenase / fumarate reductase cytochrome b subunit
VRTSHLGPRPPLTLEATRTMASTTAPPTGAAPETGGSSRRGSTVYRGDLGMWSWVAHRITGVLTFFFLFAHVLDTAVVRVSPNAYDKVIELYKNPLVNLLELGLVAAVLYHALNGIRIMLVDFWAKGPRFQRPMLWAIIVIWVLVMIPGAYFMLQRTVTQLLGGGN